jgi:hypothetical protein
MVHCSAGMVKLARTFEKIFTENQMFDSPIE